MAGPDSSLTDGGPSRAPDVAARIRSYLGTHVVLDDGVELTDGTYLLSGLVDSLGLMELVAFLEDEFRIALEYSDVDPDNFRTVGDIANLVNRRAQTGGTE
jgi:acyl carrier protein